jgi:hypothetical protein
MLFRKEWTHSKCPCCGADNETSEHVIKCPSQQSRKIFLDALDSLAEWMEKQNTQPSMQAAILEHLRSWVSDGPEPYDPERSAKLRAALIEQESIGWFPFMMGLHTTKFAEIQHHYYLSLDRQNTGLRWTTALITKLFDVAWDMWDQRNKVLKSTPHELFQIDQVRAADATIEAEFKKGKTTLLGKDRHLLRFKRKVKALPLAQKQLWISTVTVARAAHRAHREDRQSRAYQLNMQSERTRLGNWLRRHTPNPQQPNNNHTYPPAPSSGIRS